MISNKKIVRVSLPLVISYAVTLLLWGWLDRSSGNPAAAKPSNDNGTSITEIHIDDVTSTTVRISWKTNPPESGSIHLDSELLPVFPTTQPVTKAFQGVSYAPGEYGAYLSWIDRAEVATYLVSDVDTIAGANFNTIVLYPTKTIPGEIHPWDRIVMDRAALQGLKIVFRLEWYESWWFNWEPGDCDTILDEYEGYLGYFQDHPDLLLFFLIHMPLDDPALQEPNPTISQQRAYMNYCAQTLKTRVPGAQVYGNTYYGWRDELHQAPIADLVDGLSLVVYSQHADEAPYGYNFVPVASDPPSSLTCKDQFDYYLDKTWTENNLVLLKKPFVLDPTGFAPAASYANSTQMNGIVADSLAKVAAIRHLQRTLAWDSRLDGWSYFKLLHKDEAGWGLIDRRLIPDPTITISHQITVTDLFPGTPYNFNLQAGSANSGIYMFTTDVVPEGGNVPPLIQVTSPPYGHQLVAPGETLTITWQDDDPDDDAQIDLFYDMNDQGCDGALIQKDISEDGDPDQYAWFLPPSLPTGSYYIHAQISDGTNPIECDYSSGVFVTSSETLDAVSVGSSIQVDGALDEPQWGFATPYPFAFHLSQIDTTTATVRSIWDQDYLVLGFLVADEQVERASGNTPWDSDSVSAVFNNGAFKCRQDVGGTGEGGCERAVSLPPCTTLDDTSDKDCGYSMEMRIQWSNLRIMANPGDITPTDFLSVDHDGNPGGSYDDPSTAFSKVSWDGDQNVDTSGRSLTLINACDRWPCIWLPLVLR